MKLRLLAKSGRGEVLEISETQKKAIKIKKCARLLQEVYGQQYMLILQYLSAPLAKEINIDILVKMVSTPGSGMDRF